ncbi:MAG: endonuclease/exonuclease/phosphatase family protein [Candidatus Micrarchaeota archaeon]|nr:endonuclease/exonuclease/phosphatase family protein [Candidatus Micrarchaeota archaeon]
MKLLSLNIWGGKLYDELSRFLEPRARDVDVFCFQEVFDEKGNGAFHAWEGARPDIYDVLCGMLKGFEAYLSEPYSSSGERLAIFVRKGVELTGSGEFELCARRDLEYEGETLGVGSRLQWIEIFDKGKAITMANVHGLWQPKSKGDIEDTMLQSKRILEFLDPRHGGKILCGDFNLDIGTKSVAVLEGSFRNLIREYGVQNTRNKFAHPQAGNFADYIFISKELKDTAFRVPSDIVSDHQAMLLEFD